jgi:hypothetical protein
LILRCLVDLRRLRNLSAREARAAFEQSSAKPREPTELLGAA